MPHRNGSGATLLDEFREFADPLRGRAAFWRERNFLQSDTPSTAGHNDSMADDINT
jgi:hypothetical protein